MNQANSDSIERMNILFVLSGCPGQFEYLIKSLAADPSNRVAVLCHTHDRPLPACVTVVKYKVSERKVTAIEGCARESSAAVLAAKKLEEAMNFRPELIVGHSGWGGVMYFKAVYPSARLVGYFEWYFCMTPAFEGAWFTNLTPEETRLFITQKNAAMLSQLESCDACFSPMKWQRDRFPLRYRSKIRVIHEGVDTDYYSPGPSNITERIPGLSGAKEIITYVARGLEPTRCFPVFMDAIRLVLARRPDCHVLIAGDDKTHYGTASPDGKTWKQIELDKGGFDQARVHFLGWIAREDYLAVLRASTVHVYLTLPFVLSWSFMQSMSVGCCLVSSATPPVQEVLRDGENGLLSDIRLPENVADRICEALSDDSLRRRISEAARETILKHYRLEDCLRKQKELLFSSESDEPVVFSAGEEERS